VRPGPAADHSPPSSVAVMEEYSYNSTHPLGHTGPLTGSLCLLSNDNAVTHFYTNQSTAMCSLDIYHWGTGLEATGRISDIGQEVLKSCFETGSSSSHSYYQILFLIASLRRSLLGVQ